MRKLYINPKGQVILKAVNKPILSTKGSLVKTRYALISSGTELSAIKSKKVDNLPLIKRFIKSKNFRKRVLSIFKSSNLKSVLKTYKSYSKRAEQKNFVPPIKNLSPIGYSCSGIIQDSNIEEFQINDRVACAGINHAEDVFVPKNLCCKVPNNVSLEEAAFATLGAIALHGIHRAEIKPGEYVGIIGTGLIGLITIQLAKIAGAIVLASDLIKKRLELAKTFGANLVINPEYGDSKIEVNKFTKGHGLDSIIICATSKSSKPLEQAVDLIRDKGKIILLGLFPINIDRSQLYYKEADLLISRSYGPGRYDPYYEFDGYDYPKDYVPWTIKRNMEYFLKLISENRINVKPLITDIIPVNQANRAYERLLLDPINNITFLLDFKKDWEKPEIIQEKHDLRDKSEKLIIGLIGCGSFAQSFHLPYLIQNPNCKIKAIATNHKQTAQICKEKYHPDYITTNYKDILKDLDINTVFIYTRHDTHAKFSIEALNSGKNVYVEKPMALTMNDCIKIHDIVKNTKLKYSIGFNRRYSPFILKAKELLEKRDNPIILNYRIANPYIATDHWIYDPNIGGGPLIGELCHFTDLILYLINSKPKELIANGGSISHKNIEVYDSCIALIEFENRSIANLIYTDLNGPNMPKERIEIYSGDSAIIIDDFLIMNTSGYEFGNWRLDQQD
ncbi:MAG: bi-domain-containing oxidoreductase, partial [Promethearchaeota archaeon]